MDMCEPGKPGNRVHDQSDPEDCPRNEKPQTDHEVSKRDGHRRLVRGIDPARNGAHTRS